ncbi:LysM peptidoglycan-binding domain-containing protein [Akkermansiaceae bacterium]|nr:LysM peptidoglycan-binding domain-containing protein [Akkermansiaceae bacterium]
MKEIQRLKRTNESKGGVTKLYAKIKKKPRKQRAVATFNRAHDAEEKSNIGGILIFLVIVHVVAIVACILHQKWSTDDVYSSPTVQNSVATSSAAATQTTQKVTAVVKEESLVFDNEIDKLFSTLDKPTPPANAGVIPSFANDQEDIAVTREEEVTVKAQPKARISIYTVKSGDNVQAIANRFGMKVEELQLLNKLKTSNIQIGQKLFIKQ